ncbi:hypothetical protein HNQ38_001050 [Desulfovibrio intestinalis]|uniref:Uncharacterized protein n=1 Tax=Desulfovibrio intestinalis TaxID=58621 RepID=A0A7W8FFK5_9BACT|nr:hypothetical protein [Desulfovibrio intestinalis]
MAFQRRQLDKRMIYKNSLALPCKAGQSTKNNKVYGCCSLCTTRMWRD